MKTTLMHYIKIIRGLIQTKKLSPLINLSQSAAARAKKPVLIRQPSVTTLPTFLAASFTKFGRQMTKNRAQNFFLILLYIY